MSQRMATWVMWAVVNFQRRMDAYARAQAERRCGRSAGPSPGAGRSGSTLVVWHSDYFMPPPGSLGRFASGFWNDLPLPHGASGARHLSACAF